MSLSRRNLLVSSAVAAAAGVFVRPKPATAAAATVQASSRQRSLRVAHITDTHIQPELAADKGVAAAFAHLMAQSDKPDLVLHTGDIIMDSFAADRDRTTLQWSLWTQTVKNHLGVPIRYTLGNHDLWGWDKKASQATGDEPDYGKKWACDVLGLDRPYHSFDQAGWHFIALDSVRPFGNGYTAFLDDEQYDWLAADLAKVSPQTPVLVTSHIPLLSVTSFINSAIDPASTQPSSPVTGRYNPARGDAVIGGAVMHGDFRKLKNLFARHPNVRVALSGHTHLIDRVDYNNVSYLCGGAVSAAWWKGKHQGECDFGYSLLDLYPDGTFTRQYVTYPWTPRT